MKKNYPRLTVDADAGCTQAGKFLCGAASFSFQDVSLAIIEKYAGKHFARLVAKYMMLDNQRQSQAPYAILTLFESSDPLVNKAEQWIRANLSRDFRIDEVASEVAVSPRTLIRRFQKSLGESPQSFTQKLRIEKCKALLETTQMSFSEIVLRCGYSDESAFRRLFKRLCDLSPREYRKRFAKAA
jgi:transcriptional regulator GlxA family with amidase domain